MSKLLRRAGAIALLFWLSNAFAAESLIVERAVYVFPAWNVAVTQSDVKKYAAEAEYVSAAAENRFTLEKLRYRSDGLSVTALLYRLNNAGETKLPVIVFNRGSFVRKDIAPELLTMFHRLAQAGFAVVAPMYRGSDGGEGRDEMGGADLNDLMNILPVVREIGSLDANNLFLYGESRGGMMVFQAIRDGFPARAAATFGAFTDLGELTSTEAGAAMARKIWPDFDQKRSDITSRRSAIAWAEKLTTPLLLMHGARDREVAASHTLRLATELAKAGKDVGVYVVAGGNHALSAHRLERDRQAVDFFRRHLGS